MAASVVVKMALLYTILITNSCYIEMTSRC